MLLIRNTGALVNYLHKALFSPTKSALSHAVKKGNLITWPGLTEEAIHKHLKMAPATAMGHMNQKRQNIRSTSKIVEVTSDLKDVSVTPLGTGEKKKLVHAVVIDQGQLYTDLTGRFPVRSSKGNWYVMIVYSYDCNCIKHVAMKSRSATEWVRAFGEVFQELTSRGFKPKLQKMDNEASAALKNYFTEQDMTYQLDPPHCHRRNAAERAIRTFKEHFVAGLASVDTDFPMHLWYRLLPQAEISLDLLRTSRLHPQLSAAAHLHGLVDYTKTAFAPPGCKIIAHEKPSQRRTWAPHGQPGYSLGPAMHNLVFAQGDKATLMKGNMNIEQRGSLGKTLPRKTTTPLPVVEQKWCPFRINIYYHKSDGYYYLSTNGNVHNFQKGIICSHHHHERQTVVFSSRTDMDEHVEKMVKQFAMTNSSPSTCVRMLYRMDDRLYDVKTVANIFNKAKKILLEEKGVDTSSTKAQQLVDYLITNTETNAVIVIHDPSSALVGGRHKGRPNKKRGNQTVLLMKMANKDASVEELVFDRLYTVDDYDQARCHALYLPDSDAMLVYVEWCTN
jgi:hypothetical protein